MHRWSVLEAILKSCASSTLGIKNHYRSYPGEHSEDYRTAKKDYERYSKDAIEYMVLLEESKLHLNEKEREKLERYIKKRKADFSL